MWWFVVFNSPLLMGFTPYYESLLLSELTLHSFFYGCGSEGFFLESVVSINLSAMSLLMSLLVFLSEADIMLSQLSKGVCWFSVLFFGATQLLFLFMMFELVMMFIYVMIIFGGSQPEKLSATHYALLYTSSLSLPFLMVLVTAEEWPLHCTPSPLGLGVYLGLFMVKTPLYGLHSWLPKAHVEAPTSGSMLLAGLLLKVGLWGAMKVVILCGGSLHLISFLSGGGIIVGAISCVTSSESKVISAYSSVCHLNLGLYGLSMVSSCMMSGNYILALGHGYISLLLFYLVGEMYHFTGTRMLHYSAGLLGFSGALSLVVIMTLLSNGGLPPTLSFWSEVIMISGIFNFVMMFLWAVLFYFMVTMYYCLFLLISLSKPGGGLKLTHTVLPTCVLGLLMVMNIITMVG